MSDGLDRLDEIFAKIDVKDVTGLMLILHKSILKRAFPSKGRAVGSDGGTFPNLSPKYKAYKSGRVQYKSAENRNRAIARRQATQGHNITIFWSKAGSRSGGQTGRAKQVASGKVMGPYAEGRRLGPRSPLPNNQLTGKTALRFQARVTNNKGGKLYFTSRGEVGASLEERKPWIMPTKAEQATVTEALGKIIEKHIGEIPSDLINIDLGTIEI